MQHQADVYLDEVAKNLPDHEPATEHQAQQTDCGGWCSVGSCESGHGFGRVLRCGREWCGVCGEKDSDAHKRRWSRWLPKVRQLRRMGYLVVTFPLEIRAGLRTKPELSAMASHVTAILKELGFARGLRRWHWFGDESIEFNPHLNFLLDSAHISERQLKGIKEQVANLVGVPCVVHYQYTTVPAKMMHLLKYVTRSTFLNRWWDNEFADATFGYRNTWSWGHWKESPAWSLNTPEEAKSEELQKLSRGTCPVCGDRVTWGAHPISSWWLGAWGGTEIIAGYWRMPPRPAPVAASPLDQLTLVQFLALRSFSKP